MDLMGMVAPKRPDKLINKAKTRVVDKVITKDVNPTEKPFQPTIVNSLDSGDITFISPEKNPVSDKTYNLIDIYSGCNLYIMFNEQFKELPNDYNIQKKFSSELELIQRESKINKFNKYNEYMSRNYDAMLFDFKIDFQSALNIEQINISDKLYFKDDFVIAPYEYNYIIDSVLGRIDHNLNTIQFTKSLEHTERIILPTTTFNILGANHHFCKHCEFNSICDGK
jgi:hypothetical protein